jgi:hypothetical protein
MALSFYKCESPLPLNQNEPTSSSTKIVPEKQTMPVQAPENLVPTGRNPMQLGVEGG